MRVGEHVGWSSGSGGAGLAADDVGWLADAYREHGAAVRVAARRVCGPGFADEVVQEVFVELWRYSGRFDPARGTLRTFLVTVARRRAIDVLRSETSRTARERRSHEIFGLSQAPQVEGPEVAVTRRDQAARLLEAVRLLPEPERSSLMVAFYEQRTYRETARILHLAEGTTKARIRSGLRHLAAVMAETSS